MKIEAKRTHDPRVRAQIDGVPKEIETVCYAIKLGGDAGSSGAAAVMQPVAVQPTAAVQPVVEQTVVAIA